jgi:hypothetical protein
MKSRAHPERVWQTAKLSDFGRLKPHDAAAFPNDDRLPELLVDQDGLSSGLPDRAIQGVAFCGRSPDGRALSFASGRRTRGFGSSLWHDKSFAFGPGRRTRSASRRQGRYYYTFAKCWPAITTTRGLIGSRLFVPLTSTPSHFSWSRRSPHEYPARGPWRL